MGQGATATLVETCQRLSTTSSSGLPSAQPAARLDSTLMLPTPTTARPALPTVSAARERPPTAFPMSLASAPRTSSSTTPPTPASWSVPTGPTEIASAAFASPAPLGVLSATAPFSANARNALQSSVQTTSSKSTKISASKTAQQANTVILQHFCVYPATQLVRCVHLIPPAHPATVYQVKLTISRVPHAFLCVPQLITATQLISLASHVLPNV